AQLMIETERGLLLAHRLQPGLDRIRPERWMTEVDRAADERAGARRRARRRGEQVRPVRGLERVVVIQPLVAAERAARQFELEDVVEHTPGPERLPLAVAVDVVGEPGAGG